MISVPIIGQTRSVYWPRKLDNEPRLDACHIPPRENFRIEQHLYERGRHLFNEGLDVVFFDTTSTYFEGWGWEGWAKLGKSRETGNSAAAKRSAN